VLGHAERPWLIFCHGAGLNQDLFLPQAKALVSDYRLVLWDLPGHGNSKPMPPRLQLAEVAQDLQALLKHMGCRRASFVGQSMGADLVQEYAYCFPDQVSSMALMGALRLLRPRGVRERLGALLAPLKLRVVPLDRFREQVVQFSSPVAESQAYVRSCFEHLTRVELIAIWTAIARAPRAKPEHRYQVPLLLILGEQDPLGQGHLAVQAQAWMESEPQGQLVSIPGAGHTVNLDEPALVNGELLEFLRRNAG
jgi:pimeloyl-ACP methyl ester carboxylesterase